VSAPRGSDRRQTLPLGRVVMSIAAVAAPVGAVSADWNATHVYNPTWPPHAKFHNAQTIALAFAASGLALWQAWRPGPLTRDRLTTTAVYAGLFWATQIPAPFFPGSAVVDEDNPLQPKRLWVIPINQVTGAVIMMPVLLAAHRREVRRLARAERR